MGIKTVNFKCPKCGHTWSITIDAKANPNGHQRCPMCKRYSDNCYVPFNAWALFKQQLQQQGDKK